MYAIDTKKESAAPNVPAPEGNPLSLNTDSTIKISVLLGIVNKYFPDILPENVYKHFDMRHALMVNQEKSKVFYRF